MYKYRSKQTQGFTLIELLVSMAIIGLLSSIVVSSVSQARLSAQDAKRKADLMQINKAINLFYNEFGRMPRNYNCNVSYCPGGGGNFGACDAPVPNVPGTDSTNLVLAAYNASMQELVNAGYLPYIPRSTPGHPGYCYYNFGSGSTGAVMMTALETGAPTVQGVSPSCRPWLSNGATWCEQRSSMEYCLCNSY